MRYAWKVSLVLLLTVFLGSAEAATEWVKLYRSDRFDPEWIQIITDVNKGQVVAIYDNSFTIDVGMDEGARRGGMYLVYSERVPHRGKEPIAVLVVNQTAEKFSICDMTPYVSGGLVHVGDRIAPVAVTSTHAPVGDPAAVAALPVMNVTEGYISQNGPYNTPIPAVYSGAAQVPAPAVQYAAPAPAVQYAPPVAAYPPQPQVIMPDSVAAYSPPMAAPAPMAVPAPMAAAVPAPVAYPEPVQYNYQPPAQPSYQPPAQMPTVQAPAPGQSPFPGNVTYPPYPNYQNAGQVQLDFDANKIADARLIRTLPLSQPDMNALEIQFRGAYDLFAGQRYYEAFEAFMQQTSFQGNYLSPYWAGMSALRIGDRQTAITLFNNALAINPYYEPARHGLLTANGTITEAPRQQPAPTKPRPSRRTTSRGK
jgi:hypothetical protein